MDIAGLMPLLLNFLGGGNSQQNLSQHQNNIPQEVLASYPESPLEKDSSTYTKKDFQNTPPQAPSTQNLLLSLLQGNIGLGGTNNTNSSQPLDMLKSLMPLIQNTSKQKNSPPKFSELKSVDDYIFD